MLKISEIKKSFDNQEILRNVCFEAHDGQLTIIEGQNGAGKSTLFNIILGTMSADHGLVLLDNKDVSKISAEKRCKFLGVLKQDPKASSVASMSLWENCAFAKLKNRSANFHSALRPKIKEEILSHLTELQIDHAHHLDKPLGNLSGGQRQILAFAMAVINKPRLLLLDEPTAALDEPSAHQLMLLIKKLITKWSIPALMISHNHALNQLYGDAIIVLKNGTAMEKE